MQGRWCELGEPVVFDCSALFLVGENFRTIAGMATGLLKRQKPIKSMG